MIKKRFIFALAFFAWFPVSAQQNNIWYFGIKAGLDFNTGPGSTPPVSISNSVMTANEGCSSICDLNGQLLFYSNGVTVYNRFHQVMLNGDQLAGHISSVQSSLIVPKPGNPGIFYLFTSDAFENYYANGYCYSVIDMQGDNGKGAVISKNNILQAPGTERMAAVRHANGTAVWLITNDNSSNIFRAWLIDCNGVSTTPVISQTGMVLDQDFLTGVGMMKASPDGRQICQTHFSETTNSSIPVQLFDFDNATGILFNPRTVGFPDMQVNTCEFSPDSKLLYLVCTTEGTIEQVEATLPTAAAIIASRISLNTNSNFFGIQLAPDQKIYVCEQSVYMGVINYPNKKGAACNLQEKQVKLETGNAYLGLPAFINDLSYNSSNGFSYQILDSCAGTIQFHGITSLTGPVQWHWDFGDGHTSSLPDPVNTFVPADQVYSVRVEITSGLSCGKIVSTANVFPKGITAAVDFDFFASCDSGYVRFINKNPSLQDVAGQYLWDFGDGATSALVNPLHTYQQPGSYPVKLKLVTTTSCLDDSLIKTVAMPGLDVTISGDQTIFRGQKIQLFVDGPGTIYNWSPPAGLSNPFVARPFASPDQDILYTAKVTNTNGCSGEDSVRITVADLDGIFVPTAFTPDNDGKNDDIRPFFGNHFTLKEFSIFSRWGERVFTTHTRDEGWTGKVNGIEQKAGVYVWYLKFVDSHGKMAEKKGTLMLLR